MVILTVFTISLIISIPLASSQETEDEHPFSYKLGAKNGPENWHKVNASWDKCGTGQTQSPIDISIPKATVNPTLGGLLLLYRPAKGMLKSRGHDIEIKPTEDAGGMQIFGDIYFMTQMHYHYPSEHSINGKRYPLELHMVHQTPDGSKLAVTGQLYDYGQPDPFLAELEHHLKIMKNKHKKEKEVKLMDPYKLNIDSEQYFRYNGSLSVPPCTEGVIWNVFKKINTVSQQQVALLKAATNDLGLDNARPIQKLNGRLVDSTKAKKA
ncbi:Alpha carbonic anhydrase 7 [Carex littledalei]|uniref:Carbonic anhydrase n=1 Tax=Carex littledalei TaxID=544730 RepID=A0A833QLC1_9POAL|nr:Alpha carbonic anhydrase 7 [Carex littledalei]